MALAGTTHYEIRADATAGNLNAGGFNVANANGLTDLTTDANTGNTSSPVVSSASYNFVAGDVGHYIFIKSGTNWIPGWYQIASVASNKATLNAAVGAVTLYGSLDVNTAAGCATVGTPTNGTFMMDYSRGTSHIVTNTDGSAAGTTTFTSAGSTFTNVMVGNLIHITTGGGLTVGWYEIVQFTDATHVVLDRTPGTGSSATFRVGGALSMNSSLDDDFLDTPAAGAIVWVNGSAGTVSLGEAITQAANGTSTATSQVLGYASVRGDKPTGSTRPLIDCGANNYNPGNHWTLRYLQFTGSASIVLGSTNVGASNRTFFFCQVINTSTTGGRVCIEHIGTNGIFFACECISYKGVGITTNAESKVINCYVHACDTGIDCSGTNGAAMLISNCVVSDFVTRGIRVDAGTGPVHGLVTNCTVFGALNTRGIGIAVASQMRVLMGNIISGCATGVAAATAMPHAHIDNYNTYYNNDADIDTAANWTKGLNDLALNPSFTNVGQVTGTAGKFDAGGSKLIDTTKDFSALGVVVGDFVYIASGTGLANVMFYKVTSISTTTNPNDTLNLDSSPGTNTTADKVYEIETGHNFLPTQSDVLISGFPQAFPGGFTTSKPPIGAVSSETGGSSGSSGFIGIQGVM